MIGRRGLVISTVYSLAGTASCDKFVRYLRAVTRETSMRGSVGGILTGFLLCASGAWAQGYGPYYPGGGNVVWPPPGGVDRVQPPLPAYPPPQGQGYRDYGNVPNPYGRQPGYRRYGEFIRPPGAEWPVGAFGPLPPAAPKPLPKPLEPGHPVEVVPPPGIPVDEVKQAISNEPDRGWRPVGAVPEKRMKMPDVPQQQAPGESRWPPAREESAQPASGDPERPKQ